MASSPESTTAAVQKYVVPGYDSVAQMAERDDIDLIAITVRVPEHRRLLEPVLDSGKVILSEWPLALNVAEAEYLRDAGTSGPRFVGLQGHVSPTLLWVRDLIREGYVGDVLSSAMLASFPSGGPTFTSANAYTADASNGATMFTIAFAHALDMQSVLLGPLTDTKSTIATLQTEALVTDTGLTIPKSSPDQVAANGRLPNGAVVSMHFRAATRRTTPLLWEINGTRGSLRLTGNVGLPMSAAIAVEGGQGDDTLAPLTLPDGCDLFPTLAGTPAHNVAHLYAQIVAALAGQPSEAATFDYAVELHRALDALRGW